MRLYLLFLFIYLGLSNISKAQSPSDSDIKWTKPEIEQIWKKRLESFLSKGVIPIIDMESTINDEQSRQLSDSSVIKKMDALGIALIAFDVNQAHQTAQQVDTGGDTICISTSFQTPTGLFSPLMQVLVQIGEIKNRT